MVYIDDMFAPYGRMKMCHMVADTHEELVAMADTIGVARRWIQNPGEYDEHFDVCQSKRLLAIRAGAKPIRYGRELAEILERKKGNHEIR